jgi:hypothetical protein
MSMAHDDNSSIKFLASFRSRVSKPFGEPAVDRREAGGSEQRGEGKARQPIQVTGNQFTINATDVLYSAMPQ